MANDSIFFFFDGAPEYHPIPRNRALVLYFAQVARPHFYNLILLNHHDTGDGLKHRVLRDFLHKGAVESLKLIFELQQTGRAVAGRFSHETAETKALQIGIDARALGYRFEVVLEKI